MLDSTPSFSVDSLLVYQCESPQQVAQLAAQEAHCYLKQTLHQQGNAAVLLATGNSQIQFLETLIDLGGLDWSQITLFHLDEYLGIEAEHPASFRYYLRERVEKQVNPKIFHYIKGDALQPLQECDRYTQLLQAQPIDLCFLGLGENGHLAFNDPDVADFQETKSIKLVKLDTVTRQQQVKTGLFPNLDNVPQYAFTVTLPLICSTRKILCLAPELRKAKAVKSLLTGEIQPQLPASILRHQPQATLFLDGESASFLPPNLRDS